MKWLDAFYKFGDKPSYTNREASGLIRLARSMFNTYDKQPVPLTLYDWYAYALPALGWFKDGDKFKVDTKHQLQPYAASPQLRAALVTLASELDEASVPFKMIVDPRGTDAVFRALANDAWAAMKALGKEGAQPPDLLERDWEAQAVKDNPLAAAAAKGKKTKKEPEQMPLPGVLPVGPPIPTTATEKKGGGSLWLLLLLAVASTRSTKRSGRR